MNFLRMNNYPRARRRNSYVTKKTPDAKITIIGPDAMLI